MLECMQVGYAAPGAQHLLGLKCIIDGRLQMAGARTDGRCTPRGVKMYIMHPYGPVITYKNLKLAWLMQTSHNP